MKFRNNLAWTMAMDELQGDIPDPSSFCSAERIEADVPAARSAAHEDASGVTMHTASAPSATRPPACGPGRSGSSGGSRSC